MCDGSYIFTQLTDDRAKGMWATATAGIIKNCKMTKIMQIAPINFKSIKFNIYLQEFYCNGYNKQRSTAAYTCVCIWTPWKSSFSFALEQYLPISIYTDFSGATICCK